MRGKSHQLRGTARRRLTVPNRAGTRRQRSSFEPGILIGFEERSFVAILLRTDSSSEIWLTITGTPYPMFFVSVASKWFSKTVSLLFATLAGRSISVAAKGVKAIVGSDPDSVGAGQWTLVGEEKNRRRTSFCDLWAFTTILRKRPLTSSEKSATNIGRAQLEAKQISGVSLGICFPALRMNWTPGT